MGETTTVRDRLWLWGHEPGSHDRGWNLPGESRATAVEAAAGLGIPNLVMVRYKPVAALFDGSDPGPGRPFKRVVRSIVGAGGDTSARERAQVIRLARQTPNVTGVIMDDFFRARGNAGSLGCLPPEELRRVRSRLASGPHRLDLWVVLYDYQLGLPVREMLAFCDKVTFWTWRSEDLRRLEDNFAALEALTGAGKLLGCYLWDYGRRRPMPTELLAEQCRLGLEWLRGGRIEGMIFLASCLCDLGLESVEFARRWVAENSETVLQPGGG